MDVIGAIGSRTSINTAVNAADRLRQTSEFNNQLETNTVNSSPLENIRSEISVDPTAPVNGPLSQPENGLISANIDRGNNLDISV